MCMVGVATNDWGAFGPRLIVVEDFNSCFAHSSFLVVHHFHAPARVFAVVVRVARASPSAAHVARSPSFVGFVAPFVPSAHPEAPSTLVGLPFRRACSSGSGCMAPVTLVWCRGQVERGGCVGATTDRASTRERRWTKRCRKAECRG